MRARVHPCHGAVHAFGQPVLQPSGGLAIFGGWRDPERDEAEPARLCRKIGAQVPDRLGINKICGG